MSEDARSITDRILKGVRKTREERGDKKENKFSLRPHERVRELKERLAKYNEKHEHQPGHLVQWKPGLKNRRIPEYDEPVIVVDLHPGLIDTGKDSGSGYFNEAINLRIARLWEDDDFIFFHVDGARFEPFKE